MEHLHRRCLSQVRRYLSSLIVIIVREMSINDALYLAQPDKSDNPFFCPVLNEQPGTVAQCVQLHIF